MYFSQPTAAVRHFKNIPKEQNNYFTRCQNYDEKCATLEQEMDFF